MNHFVSTRGGEAVSFREAVLRGLASDGGLFVPAEVPELSEACGHKSVTNFDEHARLATLLALPGETGASAVRVVRRAFNFPVPLIEVDSGVFVLELFHGPTGAFKDFGARFMAGVMGELLSAGDPTRTVLVATSGDTGGAVASAFSPTRSVRTVVLFPRDGISLRQRRQMTTLDRVTACAVDGSFDDCQRVVKEAFSHAELVESWGLTAANSINVARLVPQASYYLFAANKVVTKMGQAPHFVVPSGNLGNLCAGLLAARAGMPHAGFTGATNANRTLVDYVEGEDRRVAPASTISSAMDVAVPSNLERIRWLQDGGLSTREDLSAVEVSDEETRRTIRRVYEERDYVLDPHSAVAYAAAVRSRSDGRAGPIVVLATAHPAKFPDVVENVIGSEVAVPEGLFPPDSKAEHMIDLDPTLEALRSVLEQSGRRRATVE